MTILKPPDRPRLTARHEVFPLEKEFTAARGQTEAHVVTVEIVEGTTRGRGECVPDERCGETVESVMAIIEEIAPSIETGVVTRRILQKTLPPGAARNALDCAMWDFDSKRGASSVWQMAGLEMPHRVITAFMIAEGTPEAMVAAAIEQAHRPLLKLKLGRDDPMGRLRAVREAVPRCRLIVAADENWTAAELTSYLPLLEAAEVELIEQPLPVEADEALAGIAHRIPFCADRACQTIDDLDALANRYEAVNIKLDKAGGLTAALELQEAAREAGFRIMVSCMVGSSLGVAPAMTVAQDADWVDLDAPLALKRDRQPGLRFDGSVLYPPNVSLWG